MDTEKYATWLMENAEDERFNNIHMQGHSHVNMGTSPSSVDLHHQEDILNMLGDDDFYIFMIWNKSFASTNKVYDLKKNVLFEDKDITIKIIGATEDLDVFMSSAKEMVKTKAYTAPAYGSGYNSSYVYSGGQYTKVYEPVKPAGPYNPIAAVPSAPAKPVEVKTGGNGKDDKKSGKKEKPRTKVGAGWAGKNASQQTIFDDDDYGEGYDAFGYRGY